MKKNCWTKNKNFTAEGLTRRAFLKQSSVASSALLTVPTLYQMLLNGGKAYAANDASIATVSFVARGGFSWFTEFQGLNKLGNNITDYNSQGVTTPNVSTNTDALSLNLPMWNSSAFATAWRNLQNNGTVGATITGVSQALRDKLKNVVVTATYASTQDDTGVEMAATVNAEAQLNSMLSNNNMPIKGLLVGGLNGATNFAAIPKFNPTAINSLNSYKELFDPLAGGLRTAGVTERVLEAASKFASRLSESKARELMSQTVKGANEIMTNSRAAHTDAQTRLASSTTPPDPTTDPEINAFIPYMTNTTTNAPNDVFAAGVQALKNRQSTSLYVSMSATVRNANNTQVAGSTFDYHGQSALGLPAWQLLHKKTFEEYVIPTMLALANKDIPFAITVLHDGCASMTTNPNAPAQGDSDAQTIHITFHWQPGSKVNLVREQLGGYNNNAASIDPNGWEGAAGNAPANLIGAARLATLADRLRLNSGQVSSVMDATLLKYSFLRQG